MSKKIKLMLMLMIISILLGLGTAVNAYSPNGLFPQRDGLNTYYCKEKGGALRLFKTNLLENNETGWVTILTYTSQELATARKKIEEKIGEVKDIITSEVEKLGENHTGYIINGSNFNGSFIKNPRTKLV